jgi:hypothetical protein
VAPPTTTLWELSLSWTGAQPSARCGQWAALAPAPLGLPRPRTTNAEGPRRAPRRRPRHTCCRASSHLPPGAPGPGCGTAGTRPARSRWRTPRPRRPRDAASRTPSLRAPMTSRGQA